MIILSCLESKQLKFNLFFYYSEKKDLKKDWDKLKLIPLVLKHSLNDQTKEVSLLSLNILKYFGV